MATSALNIGAFVGNRENLYITYCMTIAEIIDTPNKAYDNRRFEAIRSIINVMAYKNSSSRNRHGKNQSGVFTAQYPFKVLMIMAGTLLSIAFSCYQSFSMYPLIGVVYILSSVTGLYRSPLYSSVNPFVARYISFVSVS